MYSVLLANVCFFWIHVFLNAYIMQKKIYEYMKCYVLWIFQIYYESIPCDNIGHVIVKCIMFISRVWMFNSLSLVAEGYVLAASYVPVHVTGVNNSSTYRPPSTACCPTAKQWKRSTESASETVFLLLAMLIN